MTIQQFCLGWIRDLNPLGSILGVLGMVLAMISLSTSYDTLKVSVAVGLMIAGLQIGYLQKMQSEMPKDIRVSILELTLYNSLLTFLLFAGLTGIVFSFAYFSDLNLGAGLTALLYFGSLLGFVVLFTASLPYTASRAIEEVPPSRRRYEEHLRNSFQENAFLKLVFSAIAVYLLCPATWYIYLSYLSRWQTPGILVLGHLIPPIFCLAWGSANIATTCPKKHRIPGVTPD